MSEQAPPTSALSADSFGGNEWLIEEQFAKYKKDPDSVEPSWREFFADNRPGSDDADNGTDARSGRASQRAASTQTPAEVPDDGAAAPSRPAPQERAARAAEEPAPEPAPHEPEAHSPDSVDAEEAPAQQKRADLPPKAPEVTAVAPTATYVTTPSAGGPRSTGGDDEVSRLRGAAARVVSNMETSLEVPTATSVRTIPAKLLVDNRIVLNNHLQRGRGGKVSFTHLIGFAIVEALAEMPEMNAGYREVDGKPGIVHPANVNFGLAIDLARPDGTRQLLVPSVKSAEKMNFAEFWVAYEELVGKARDGKLGVEDFSGTTITLTNPGTIGTVHSVPRLMQGQGTIIGVGAMNYPAEFEGASEETLAKMGISKTLTLTSTYDHRIIQGAQSGDFLRIVHNKLLGTDGFFDRVFAALRVPYEPVRWTTDTSGPEDEITKPARISELIHAFRSRGHLIADTDPLGYRQRKHPDLDVQNHGLTLWDLDRSFPTGGFGGKPRMPLRDILGLLRNSYCRTIGVEYMHLHDGAQRRWMQERLESGWTKPVGAEQRQILRTLNAAEAFETFLQTKFVGQKRFSLEGGESLIPLLDRLLQRSAQEGLDEVAIGMPHRGRLNVLANIAGKSYGQIFAEFEGNQDPRSVQGSGDVKYHLGTEGTYTSHDGETTKVYLAANPSHLEAVNGVLEGVVRAKQDRIDLGGSGFSVLPVLIHGDAAFAGQGVVQETLQMSQLRGYRTGGTVHIIINNQVGFTAGASSTRSTLYSTDVAKGLQVPIFHVNGDDPEAVAHVAALAFDYRQEFNKDVIIDLISYRRRGHNEGDDPSMTQPVMYDLIEDKKSVRVLFTEALVGRGDLTQEEADEFLADYRKKLERVFTESRSSERGEDPEAVAGLERPESQQEDAGVMVGWQTAVPANVLARIGETHMRPPEGFTAHPKLKKLLQRRSEMSTEGNIDWAFGELAAFGSLLLEDTPVRLAGQDSRRGTFVQRHAVLHDYHTGAEWTPLMYLATDQAKFWVHDSLLSEYAAVAFEYGYSVERPDALVLWEAQFGDFVNGAQTVIDEFISSAEQKWAQNSSVVLLLPHGYEGQGPDHSSARIERFLQLCAENNMIVAQPSTPANHFHMLRRQAYQRPRVPLVVFTPKQLLRLRAATSQVEDFTSGTFKPVIGDEHIDPSGVDRVMLCSGRVYYDLLSRRVKEGDDRTALVRVEEFYPLPADEISAELDRYPGAELIWVQDEPRNQGAWNYMHINLPETVPAVAQRGIRGVTRPESAAPSTGSPKVHAYEQEALLDEAFAR